ncbi:MAG: DinB family protein [Acidobacteriota bacterium]
MVNHSSYHRGQVTTLLRQSGLPAVSTDFVLFCRERL